MVLFDTRAIHDYRCRDKLLSIETVSGSRRSKQSSRRGCSKTDEIRRRWESLVNVHLLFLGILATV